MSTKKIKNITKILSVLSVLLLNTGVAGAMFAVPNFEIIDRPYTGTTGQNWDDSQVDVSADGRYAVYYIDTNNQVPNDTNSDNGDIFIRDRLLQTTKRLMTNDGSQPNGSPYEPMITHNGKFILYISTSTNITPEGKPGVFLYNTETSQSTFIANNVSGGPCDVTEDGRYVTVGLGDGQSGYPGDTNGFKDIFRYDTQTSTLALASNGIAGSQSNSYNWPNPTFITDDGRYVIFWSDATNLVPGDTNGLADTFIKDMVTGQITRVMGYGGAQTTGGGTSPVDISSDGKKILLDSGATNMIASDTNGWGDVFLYDIQTGVSELVSKSTTGVQADRYSEYATISPDGNYVAFISYATNLDPDAPAVPSGATTVYVRSLLTQTTHMVTDNGTFLRMPDRPKPMDLPYIKNDADFKIAIGTYSDIDTTIDNNFNYDTIDYYFIGYNIAVTLSDQDQNNTTTTETKTESTAATKSPDTGLLPIRSYYYLVPVVAIMFGVIVLKKHKQ